jgi:hypothetical protein
MKKMILTFVLLFMPVLVFAQNLNSTDLKNNTYITKGASSLFDPSRLTMHQSFTLGFYSGQGGNQSIGYYLNSIEYSISNPLKIRFDLGVLGGSSLVSRTSSKSASFIPGVSIDWRPSSAFHFRLDVRQVPVYNNGYYNSYYNPGYWEDYH